jgi:hypothetical protein
MSLREPSWQVVNEVKDIASETFVGVNDPIWLY